MPVLQSHGQIFPDKTHNAIPPAAKAIRSPRALLTRRRCRRCSEADQRTEFPPIPAAELSPLLRLQDAGPRPGSVSDVISSSKFPVQRFGDANWDKAGDIAPETRDFFHDSGAEISVLLLRHEENRFHAGIEFSVHQRHLKFEFKIGNGSQTANDRARFLRPCKVDQQSLELGDSHTVDLSGGFSEQIETFL